MAPSDWIFKIITKADTRSTPIDTKYAAARMCYSLNQKEVVMPASMHHICVMMHRFVMYMLGVQDRPSQGSKSAS